MDLRGYEQAKFELAEILQAIVTAKGAEGSRTLQERLRDLLARLAEDRFNLIVAGRFSRGKSSLMNAILGMDRLPTGILPLTSVITTVSYGTTERVTLKYQGRRLDTEISLKELARYVTQQGNPGNQLGVATANIELTADILRRGFHFVDTPGLGSVITENTFTTKAYLPEADGLLLVTGFESPLSEEELGFFSAGSRIGLPIFVAVNKQDLVSAAERDETINFVRSQLQEQYGHRPQDVFSVSARDGLAAKLSNDAARSHASGLPALEDRLTRFLLEQKRTVFLARMSARVEGLIDDLPLFDGVPELHRHARTLSDKYRGAPRDNDVPMAESTVPAFRYSQLRSCEICAAVEVRTRDFLARYQYQLATDHNSQRDFAQRSGFCCYHTAEYERIASPFGTCSGYPPLLERLAASFRRVAAAGGPDPVSVINESLSTHDKCLVCELRDKAEALAVMDVANRLNRDSTAGLENLSALCLPHLAAVSQAIINPDVLRALINIHALTLERIAEDMHRFTLKQSAARRQLQTEEEQSAAQRGLSLLAGRSNANFSVGQVAASPSNIRRLPSVPRR